MCLFWTFRDTPWAQRLLVVGKHPHNFGDDFTFFNKNRIAQTHVQFFTIGIAGGPFTGLQCYTPRLLRVIIAPVRPTWYEYDWARWNLLGFKFVAAQRGAFGTAQFCLLLRVATSLYHQFHTANRGSVPIRNFSTSSIEEHWASLGTLKPQARLF